MTLSYIASQWCDLRVAVGNDQFVILNNGAVLLTRIALTFDQSRETYSGQWI